MHMPERVIKCNTLLSARWRIPEFYAECKMRRNEKLSGRTANETACGTPLLATSYSDCAGLEGRARRFSERPSV